MKAHTLEALRAMSLKQLAALVNMPSLVKLSKTTAARRAYAALPDVRPTAKTETPKVGGYKADSKFGRLYALLEAGRQDRAQLMAASGFDDKNLSVALSIMKKAGHVVRVEWQGEGEQKHRTYALA